LPRVQRLSLNALKGAHYAP